VTDIVECRSDFAYAQRPIAFVWQGRRIEVQQVLNSWRSPSGISFTVLTEEQSVFTLTYLDSDDHWSIEFSELPPHLESNKESK